MGETIERPVTLWTEGDDAPYLRLHIKTFGGIYVEKDTVLTWRLLRHLYLHGELEPPERIHHG